MFDAETRAAAVQIADRLNVPVAALLAVAEVESAGRTLARVDGKDEPVIRFEGHYFDRFLRGDARLEARADGLSSPRAGAVRNPRSQANRWKLLKRAIKINRIAALSSVSWGLGQVMGAHWQWLGYGSVDALVTEARSGVAGQLRLMGRYIEKSGLASALRERDWVAFARTYYGPGYKRNKYDTKMAAAFLRLSLEAGNTHLPVVTNEDVSESDERLMFGSRGVRVKQLQNGLTRLGYVLVADGLFGLVTDRVVRQFQRDHLIPENGIVAATESDLIFPQSNKFKTKAKKVVARLKKGIPKGHDSHNKRTGSLVRKISKSLQKAVLSISRRFA